jgi:predicted DNA-binding WGR domain protein
MATRLVFTAKTSNKFWEAETKGKKLVVRWGRIGTTGQSKTYELDSPAAAKAEAERQIAEKRRKGYRDADAAAKSGTKAAAKTAAKASKPSRETEALADLGRMLARKDAEGLVSELELAVADPVAYFERFRDRLSERGVDAPDETYATTLPWLALIDGLDARASLHEVDWKQEIDDVAAKLERLAKLGKKWWAWSKNTDEFETTTDFLRTAARRLADEDLQLAFVDMSSDSYPLVVYAKKSQSEARGLSERCKKAGFGQLAFFLGGTSKPAPAAAPAVTDTTFELPLASPDLVGWAPPHAIFTSDIDSESVWADLSVWPPRLSPKLPFWVDSATRGPDGRWVLFAGEWGGRRVERYRVLVADAAFAETFTELTVPKQRRGLKLTVGGFVDGRVIAIPGATSTLKALSDSTYSKAAGTDRVHWQDGDHLVPAPGLPPWRELHFMIDFITLPAGGGVLLWDDNGYELVDGAFQVTFPGPFRWGLSQRRAKPVPTDNGFYFVSRTLASGSGSLFQARRGKAKAAPLLPAYKDVGSIHAGPDGSLLVMRGKALLYRPETGKYAELPAAALEPDVYELEYSNDCLFGVKRGQNQLVRVPAPPLLAPLQWR